MSAEASPTEKPAGGRDHTQNGAVGRGQRASNAQWARYREVYTRVYVERRAQAVADGLSAGMADHAAEVRADAEATRQSGIRDPARQARVAN
jgi:hypothetical protein